MIYGEYIMCILWLFSNIKYENRQGIKKQLTTTSLTVWNCIACERHGVNGEG